MISGFISFFLALIGLGFLVLIHETGHYLMARRAGIRIEVFGIGFGRPIWSFFHKGVRVNICWIPFGGYVKIAGMESKSNMPPYSAPDGFFAKAPLVRMQVALCGPLANILFALVAFSLIWITGGREKSFSDVTGRVGWMDQNSELFAKGVRPGDLILAYNNRLVQNSKNHFYAAMTAGSKISVEVEKLGSRKQDDKVVTLDIHPYQHPLALEKGILTTGILAPAEFLIWNIAKGGKSFTSEAQVQSGILPSDRIMWVDGELIASQMQLSALINDGCLFVTVRRDGRYVNLHIPRLPVGELKLTQDLKGEISDWQYEAGLESTNTNQLWFLPYNLTSDGIVEGSIPLLDAEVKEKEVKKSLYHDVLLPKDQIVAVAGQQVSSAVQIVKKFQQKHVLVIVDRIPISKKSIDLQDADALFKAAYQSPELAQLVQSIGTPHQIQQNGTFILLHPIAPKTRAELLKEAGRKDEIMAEKEEEERFLQAIEDPQLRLQAEQNLQLRDRQLFLGLSGIHDKVVLYNPDPISECFSIVEEVYQTIGAFFGGYLSPKWMSGPVGILHVIQQQWSIGYKEALFWLGTISLNLAVLNLLPLPVLDGGYILLSLFEMITGIRLKVETIEKIVLPFAILLIGFLIYLTYHDLVRLFGNVISRLSHWKG